MSNSVTVICTGIVSSYHLANVYALIKSQYSGHNVKLFVCVDNFWGRSVIPARYFQYGVDNFNLVVLETDVLKALLNHKFESSRYVFIGVSYVSFLTYFRLKFFYRKEFTRRLVSFYSIDEGLGSHVLTYVRTMKRQFKESGNKLKFMLSYNARFVLYEILDRIYKTKHNRLYDLHNNKVVVNQDFSKNLKSVFIDLSCLSSFDFDSVNNVVIYLDQPLSSIGVCDEYCELNSIPKGVLKFAKNHGLKPFIKPHPSRDATNVPFQTLGSTDGCVEELFCYFENKNISVIGVTSNALITAKAIFNIDAYKFTGWNIDLSPLELNHKVNLFFSHFTKSINLDD